MGTPGDEFLADGMLIAERMEGVASLLCGPAGVGQTGYLAPVTSFKSDYKPYGNPYSKTGTITFGYTGKLYDGTIGGLYYYNARFYDPDFGRFISEDSYMGSASDPMSLNRYIYARDNPERYDDPTGHMTGHVYFTDFDESQYLTTTNSCLNGVCTVITTETYGDYTAQLITSNDNHPESGGVTIHAMSTTSVNTYPINGYTTVVTTTSSTTLSGDGQPTYMNSQSEYTQNSNIAESQAIFVGGIILIGISAAFGFYPGIAAGVTGNEFEYHYLTSTPNPDPATALKVWAIGAATGLLAFYVPLKLSGLIRG